MMMTKLFTPLSLLQGDAFRIIVYELEPSIKQVSWSLLQRKLIPDKAESLELQVKDRIDKFEEIVLTYDLWMSQKNEEIFSMTAHHCEGLECAFFHIGVLATTGACGQILSNAENMFVNFLSKKNIFRFTCDRGTNLEKYQTILGNKVKIQENL